MLFPSDIEPHRFIFRILKSFIKYADKQNETMKKDYLYICITYVCASAAAFVIGWRMGNVHPILKVAAADGAATIIVFLFSLILNNSSVYDLYWSVAPVPIALFLALVLPAPDFLARKVIVVFLLCAWAVRLSWNWVRRWRGLEHEDWRYARFRRKYPTYYWFVSLGGIHLFPTAIVFLGCLSLFPSLTAPLNSLNFLDAAAAGVILLAIALQYVADRQMDGFLSRPDSPGGIMREGLWSLSRHPNYFGEVLFWWGLWLFGLASNPAMAWTVIGPAAMTLMFLSISIPMIERRLTARRPAYGEYQRRVPMLLPGPKQAIAVWRAQINRGRSNRTHNNLENN